MVIFVEVNGFILENDYPKKMMGNFVWLVKSPHKPYEKCLQSPHSQFHLIVITLLSQTQLV